MSHFHDTANRPRIRFVMYNEYKSLRSPDRMQSQPEISHSNLSTPLEFEMDPHSSPPPPQLKSPKKHHTKSRNGCTACKRRKVKCDEVRPLCRNCARRFGNGGVQACDYGRKDSTDSVVSIANSDMDDEMIFNLTGGPADQLDTTGLSLSFNADDLFSGPLIPCLSETSAGSYQSNVELPNTYFANINLNSISFTTPSLNLGEIPSIPIPSQLHAPLLLNLSVLPRSEISLFHHYMNDTCHEMPFGDIPEIAQIWSVDFPQLALRSAGVLEVMLATAALHLRTKDPQDDQLVLSSYYYFDRALNKMRDDLQNITAAKADALFLSVFLIRLQAWLIRPLDTNSSYSVPIATLRMSAGAQSILRSISPYIQNHALLSLSDGAHQHLGDITASDRGIHSRQRYEDLLELLEDIDGEIIEPDMTVRKPLLSYLVSVHAAMYDDSPKDTVRYRVIQASMDPPHELIKGAEMGQPFSLAVLARVFALWNSVDGVWWINGVAQYEMEGICRFLGPEGESLLNWPMAKMGVALLSPSES